MKTTKRLNIEYKPDYFFMNMTNINDFDLKLLLINELQLLTVDQQCLKLVIVKNQTLHILFLMT